VIGSSVREISNAAPMVKMNWPHGGNPATVRGEAVVIDLGQRGVIFALINEDAEAQRFYKAFPPPDRRPQSDDTFRYYAQLPVGTSATLDQENWPQFVTFTDMNDPKSVTLVRGGKFNSVTQKHDPVDDLEELFGAGVKLKSIELEITDEPVTWKINEILSWLPNVKKGSLDGRMGTFTPNLSSELHYGNFKTGELK